MAEALPGRRRRHHKEAPIAGGLGQAPGEDEPVVGGSRRLAVDSDGQSPPVKMTKRMLVVRGDLDAAGRIDGEDGGDEEGLLVDGVRNPGRMAAAEGSDRGSGLKRGRRLTVRGLVSHHIHDLDVGPRVRWAPGTFGPAWAGRSLEAGDALSDEHGDVPFGTVVAVVDLVAPRDRALSVVAGLARAGVVPVEIVAVIRPDESAAAATRELERRVEQHGLRRTTCYALHGESPGRTIIEHVSVRDGALVVIATSGSGARGEKELDPITEDVLHGVRQPVVVVGPAAQSCVGGPLVVAVDGTGIARAAIPVVEAWVRTVPGPAPRLVTVIPPGTWPADGVETPPEEVATYVDLLYERGIAATAEVLRELEAPPALAAYAAAIRAVVVVVTSPRSRDRGLALVRHNPGADRCRDMSGAGRAGGSRRVRRPGSHRRVASAADGSTSVHRRRGRCRHDAPIVKAWVVRRPGADRRRPARPRRPAGAGAAGRARCACASRCAACAVPISTSPRAICRPAPPDVVPGHEVVGIVDAVGPGAPASRRGPHRHRLAAPHLRRHAGSAGAATRTCASTPAFTGWDADGGYAEYAVVDERFAYRLPAGSATTSVAPLLCAGIIGFRALRRAALPPGGRLGIYGFGASAHLAAQVAIAEGATVHVMTRSAEARGLALRLGAAWAATPSTGRRSHSMQP